ncbi:MAG: hypothetical protein F4Y50_14805 [Dehalococcoidia bacterium]|nr:hypothetical protein [Dehalococcoidia bacterium]
MDKSRRLYEKLLFAAVLVVVVSSFPTVAQANGRVTNFQKKITGPYEIGLGTIPPSPSVGNLHLALTVTDPATKAPVLDARVELYGAGPDSTEIEIGPTTAANSAQDPTYYEVNTSVSREGIWLFTTTITDADGEHSADFQVEVKNASPITGILTLVVLVAFLIIFGLSLRASLGGKRRRRKKRAD